MIDTEISLEKILAVSEQKELWASMSRMDPDSHVLARHINGKAHREEVGESARKFLKVLHEKLALQHASLYIDGVYDIGLAIDPEGNPVPVGSVDDALLNCEALTYQQQEGLSSLVIPLRHRHKDFGAVMFQKTAYAPLDIAILRDCTLSFSQHVYNIYDKKVYWEQARTDGLTGLLNARALEEKYAVLKDGWENHGQHFGVVFADLDLFGELNKQYGHPTGSKILSKVAELIRACVRPGDILGRYGGEEFVVLLPGASREEANDVATRISNKVREYRFTTTSSKPVREVTFTASAISTSEDEMDGDPLEKANQMMLAGKRYGRDFVISNVPTHRLTGIAGVPRFMSHLGDRLKHVNSPYDSDMRDKDAGALAVLVFDIVNFSKVIDDYTDDEAWKLNADVARWFYSERKSFGFVANVFGRDQVITSLYAQPPANGFHDKVRGLAETYRRKANDLVVYHRGKPVSFDFAVGGVIYDPKLLEKETLVEDPDVLFTDSLHLTDDACEMPEKRNIRTYGA
jgi:diguanylate cyclase (GGDEF)-like protein